MGHRNACETRSGRQRTRSEDTADCRASKPQPVQALVPHGQANGREPDITTRTYIVASVTGAGAALSARLLRSHSAITSFAVGLVSKLPNTNTTRPDASPK